jgi:putative PEP-CTERM system histidine kinase
VISDLLILTAYADTILAALLAFAVIGFKRGNFVWMLFALGMLLLAIESALGVAVLEASSFPELEALQEWRYMAVAPATGIWLAFSLCYSRVDYPQSLKKFRWSLALATLGPVMVAWIFHEQIFEILDGPGLSPRAIRLGISGKILTVANLLGSILILMNLERTFRSAMGVMRWRIKYLFFGAGLLFGAKIYTTSQTLLYSSVQEVSLRIEATALLFGAALMGYSFFRTRLTESEIYPSQKVLQQSITVFIAGGYLIVIGGLAKLMTRFGGDPSFSVKAFVLMLAVISLSVMILSNHVQQRIRLFVGRHFSRPVHDHGKVWAACTERTGHALDHIELSRAVVKLVSETFEVLSVSLWLADENRRALRFGASTSLVSDQAANLLATLKDPEGLLQSVCALRGPVSIDIVSAEFAFYLRKSDPEQIPRAGSRICVPIISGREPIGFLTLANRVNCRPFSVEDLDLLTCIANQVAGTFRNLEMSRTLIQNREMQAFQAMSAFFVHDLRNSASTLSLMLKNLETHFGNPDFREDCLRSLTKSVGHMNELIKRLALLRQDLEIKKIDTDVNRLLENIIKDLGGLKGLELTKDFRLTSKIWIDPAQIRKVITNLLLNALEAVGAHGQIRVSTAQRDSWAIIAVADTGCGMSREFIDRSLFRAFQTTKKDGMGIGMFHTKAIVEAHQGRIEVQSEPGKGSTFRILLPVSSRP